jgi:hypothetical protein
MIYITAEAKATTVRGGLTGDKMLRIVIGIAFAFMFAGSASAETVDVKYRGPVSLDSFECTTIVGSSLVNRVCYSKVHLYMLIQLKQTWYHYCQIDAKTVEDLLAAHIKGRFYNGRIKRDWRGIWLSSQAHPGTLDVEQTSAARTARRSLA